MQTCVDSYVAFLVSFSRVQINNFIDCIVHTVNGIITSKMGFIIIYILIETSYYSSCYHINSIFSTKRYFSNRTTEDFFCIIQRPISFQVLSVNSTMLVKCSSHCYSPLSLFGRSRLSHASTCTKNFFKLSYSEC